MDYSQPHFYHFSEDSIVLSQIVKNREQNIESLLELGAGCAVISIEITKKFNHIERLVLLEKQIEFLPFIHKNLADFLLPHVSQNLDWEVIHSSFKNYRANEKFEVVVGNLPYFLSTNGRLGPDQNRNICRHWMEESFSDVLKLLKSHLAPFGRAYLITSEQALKKVDRKLLEEFSVENIHNFKGAKLFYIKHR